MSGALARWNGLPAEEAAEDILACGGSKAWAKEMAERRPIADETMLLTASDRVWATLSEADWLEAFRSHPRIGESAGREAASARSAHWSGEEQRGLYLAADEIRSALAEGNRRYEERFRRIFIVCATGKSPVEMLEILQRRLRNDEQTELREAAEQQRQITQLRLKKWLHS
ncbi:MAG TPA: 2-oxo-4-hydroxy-4-carboxy-5-ureidoimidazoline decarboxylase [Candidatus Acidoferrum sp.]|nr:2-oxo-4-hydroxy-4-carboxy-5-ureidoimidazoline decarboxylase [Candidatus Acidoferrum sp.]